jgi:hypothetical protein
MLPRLPRALLPLAVAPLLVLLAAGCGDKEGEVARDRTQAAGEESLPAPERTAGSVTGMPGAGDPRDSLAPPPGAAVADAEPRFDDAGNPLSSPALPIDPATLPLPGAEPGALSADASAPGLSSDPATASAAGSAQADGPGPAEAVAVLKAYYESINAGSYGRAYSLWSGGGSASGQSPQQFADGFAETSGMSVEIMAPGEVGAAAGSRYIEVPVAVSATRSDGSVRRYVGNYTLRRAVADGASAEQQSWRIASADLREVQQ